MSKRILIVDDNPQVLKLLNISLSKAGYQIYEAENGEEGLKVLGQEKPDLVISDMMMPKMDGMEFCWMVRETSLIPSVPFIFLTSFEDRDTAIRGFRAGADEYLKKPIDRKQLLDIVANLLNRHDRLKVMSEPESSKGFSGNLQELSIVELVQMYNLNKKSGILHIDGSIPGKMVIRDGHLVYAKTEQREGDQAVYEMVAMKEGTFRFESEVSDEPANIKSSTMNVLMEACRLVDEKASQEN